MATRVELSRPLHPAAEEPPVLRPGYTFGSVTDQVGGIVLTDKTPTAWWVSFAGAFALLMLLLTAVGYLLLVGVGIWGINIPVGWGWAITNFVWWIGIGHAGTLISAILLLLHQEWRTSINRFAEAMTLFAVACAGLFPLLHMGRPWFFYWLLPIPNSMQLWPQFRSPLVWDVFAVSTYLTVSLVFWYVGLLPDLATMRDRATKPWSRVLYGIPALGWRGSARHWFRHESVYLLLAGLATPLVLSVHTVVSFDFAVAQLPGWHSTVFPPYFVAGAIYSGFAMVLVLVIPVRRIYHLEGLITEQHLQNSAKIMLATGLMVAYGYGIEAFMAWYSGNEYEYFTQVNRWFGPYAPAYWLLITTNVVLPQALWIDPLRRSPVALFLIGLDVLLGMWLERYVIIVTSLHRDFMPSSWGNYSGTFWDWATFVGTLGLFMTLMILFLRVLPMISMSEVRGMLPQAKVHEEHR
jgi:molybdopterin-containing oxidoreductase family membrane subunit